MNQEIYTGILIVITLASIFSSMATTWISNQYKVKILKLKIQSDNMKRSNDLVIRVYEDFLRSAGAVITSSGLEAIHDYGKSYGLVMIHVPSAVFEDIQTFNEFISGQEWDNARDKFKDITLKLRKIVDTMYKQSL